eukprot:TRINITY_DN62137_c0_g1_i2.p1 TRINITY_DN62137_c0_g1~~TRINITY_DN62137_c0_g1_i2.p1  ORF type:complete len:262 (+),score=15.61 TRINITY_DN62137_c0_g1_i2:107-892(+)
MLYELPNHHVLLLWSWHCCKGHKKRRRANKRKLGQLPYDCIMVVSSFLGRGVSNSFTLFGVDLLSFQFRQLITVALGAVLPEKVPTTCSVCLPPQEPTAGKLKEPKRVAGTARNRGHEALANLGHQLLSVTVPHHDIEFVFAGRTLQTVMCGEGWRGRLPWGLTFQQCFTQHCLLLGEPSKTTKKFGSKEQMVTWSKRSCVVWYKPTAHQLDLIPTRFSFGQGWYWPSTSMPAPTTGTTQRTGTTLAAPRKKVSQRKSRLQ